MKQLLAFFLLILSVNALYVERSHNDLEIRAPSCISGSYGLRRGKGYNGYCCKTQADCWDDCIRGVCNGPKKLTTTKKTTTKKTATTNKTTTKKTTTKKTTTAASCISGFYGLRRGNGYKDYCCKTQADCWDDCVRGKCTGPKKPTTTIKTTTTKPSTTATISSTIVTTTETPTTTSSSTSTTTTTTTTTTSTIPTTTVTSSTTTGIPPLTTTTISTTTTTTTTTTTAKPSPTATPKGCSILTSAAYHRGTHLSSYHDPISCATACGPTIPIIALMYTTLNDPQYRYYCYCYSQFIVIPPSITDNTCHVDPNGAFQIGLLSENNYAPPNTEYAYDVTWR